jgi:hypothetical protein
MQNESTSKTEGRSNARLVAKTNVTRNEKYEITGIQVQLMRLRQPISSKLKTESHDKHKPN